MFETLEHIDKTILLAINGFNSSLLDIIFWHISAGWIFLPLWVFISLYIYRAKPAKYLVTAIICISMLVLFSDQSSNLVKNNYQRYRPTHNLLIKKQIHTVDNYIGGTYGFFSGHAANTFGVATFLVMCLHWAPGKKRYLLFLWPLIVGYSRIYLGVHYPSDIFFGAMNGMVWGFLFYVLFKILIKKWNVETQ